MSGIVMPRIRGLIDHHATRFSRCRNRIIYPSHGVLQTLTDGFGGVFSLRRLVNSMPWFPYRQSAQILIATASSSVRLTERKSPNRQSGLVGSFGTLSMCLVVPLAAADLL